MPPSHARNFFEQITQAPTPVAAIRSLVTSTRHTFEYNWLDFKMEHPVPKQRDMKIHETWSEAVGGFANNEGGVPTWGIDARKTNHEDGGQSLCRGPSRSFGPVLAADFVTARTRGLRAGALAIHLRENRGWGTGGP